MRGCRQLRYSTFLCLHDLWQQYMAVVVQGIKTPADQVKLLKADWHGAMLIVAAARNPDLVNVTGIVVQETKNTFRLITERDRIVTVPKIGCIFAFLVQETMYKVNGAYISCNPANRSRIKLRAQRKGDQV